MALAGMLSSPALAQMPDPGTLDLTFGDDGRVVTPFLNSAISGDVARAVAVDGRGRIVAAGHAFDDETNHDVALLRYLPTGSLDPDFGTGGVVVTPIGQGPVNDAAVDLLIQPDGRIVVAGYSDPYGVGNLVVLRYDEDGSPDPTFGGTGRMVVNLGHPARLVDIERQADGKILVAGSIAKPATGWDMLVLRFYANGARDLGFGVGGVFAPAINGHQEAVGVAVTGSGRLLVGAGDPLGGTSFLLARLLANGEWDTSFGSFGLVSTPMPAAGVTARRMVLTSAGRVVLAGDADDGFAVLARYLSGGGLDASFDDDGKLALQLGAYASVGDVKVQRNGKIVIAGAAAGAAALIRFDVDGTPDTGLVVTPLGAEGGGYYALALQADGRIVAAGHAHLYYDNTDFAVARYWGDVVDPIFTDGFDGS
jgi:uncharacterized delta-60 repeat protein